MRFYANEKLALVVDGPNLWNTARDLGFDVDYAKLHEFFGRQAIMVGASYFSLMRETENFNPVRQLLDWLEFNGWQVFTRVKDCDVDLAVHAMELAGGIDHLVLVSGDSDFTSLVDALQRQACRVSVVSSIRPGLGTSHCHEDLRRAADQFIDLNDLRDVIARPARAPKEALSV